MSERTRINWHQGLRPGDLKWSYRRFREGYTPLSKLETKVDELEGRWNHDERDYDDYWNPWDPAEYLSNYWTYLIQNLATVKALYSLDCTGVLGQPTGNVLSYSPKDILRLLSTHVRTINECKDLESVHSFARNVLRGVSQDDANTLAKIEASLNTFRNYTSLLSEILLLAPFWVRPFVGLDR